MSGYQSDLNLTMDLNSTMNRTVSPINNVSIRTSTPMSVRAISPVGQNATIVDPNATRINVAQGIINDLVTIQTSRPTNATAAASAILNANRVQAQPHYIDNLLSAPLTGNITINSASIVADPINVTTLDPARMVATQRLKELAIEHLKIQETDLNAMMALKKEGEALAERINKRREILEKEHERAQEALKQKTKAEQRALQVDAENRGRLIQKSQEALKEFGQEKDKKFFEAQQKVIGEYTKLMQKRV